MAAIIKIVLRGTEEYETKYRDKRTEEYLFMSSPIYPIAIVAAYLYFVLKVGPNFMKNRQPYDLSKVLLVYNIVQIICNAIYFLSILPFWSGKYRFICEPVDRSNSEEALKIANLIWWFFILKVSDLLDTVFFVLRKKEQQISFLHLYHHFGMVLISWFGVKYCPGGHATLICFLNSFVHIIMYFYYFLTNLNSDYKKSIWWKKYLTQIQIVQFFIFFLQSFLGLLKEDCQYSTLVITFVTIQNIYMLILFIDFYRKAYGKKKKKET